MTGYGPKMVHFGPKRAKHGLSTLQSGPKEPERDQGVFDHLEPFWAHLDPFGPFRTKMTFLPQTDQVGFGRGASEQNINSCLK